MKELFLPLLIVAPGILLVDALARPRRVALPNGWAVLLLFQVAVVGYGLFLGLSGDPFLAAVLVLALHLLLVVTSNAKKRMLGEPLLFSDLALVGAVFRHPQFYFSALGRHQKIAGIFALAGLAITFIWLFERNLAMRLGGLATGLLSLTSLSVLLRTTPFRRLAERPDAETDVAKLGLIGSLLLYWVRWREDSDRPTCGASKTKNSKQQNNPQISPSVIVVIQCESFADPVELFGEDELELPQLRTAQRQATRWGNLLVSGFGAYTMRTEYGVLFGREEEELGFRRYDPYLTAKREGLLALPHRLGVDRWRSIFVHPHDMRFYNRHQILPEAGFSELVDASAFDLSKIDGRYVKDSSVAEKILKILKHRHAPTFVYAVTIENHGPWSGQGRTDQPVLDQYLTFVRRSDAMLGQLREGIAALEQPALLVFFGDHRPSIPGASEPGGDRHTPYVVMQFDAEGRPVTGANQREDMTPAQLHRAILDISLDP